MCAERIRIRDSLKGREGELEDATRKDALSCPSRSPRTKPVLLPLALALMLGAYWLELHLPRLELVGVVGVVGHHDRRAAYVLAQPAPAGAHHAHPYDGQSEPTEVASHAPCATRALGPWAERCIPSEGIDVACGSTG